MKFPNLKTPVKIIVGIFIGVFLVNSLNKSINNSNIEETSKKTQETTQPISPNPTEIPTLKPTSTTAPQKTITKIPTPATTQVMNNNNGYQSIYDKYSAKLKAECPSLSITECAQLSNEGISEMAKYMYSAKGIDGQYQTYSDWAGRLMDVYMKEAR